MFLYIGIKNSIRKSFFYFSLKNFPLHKSSLAFLALSISISPSTRLIFANKEHLPFFKFGFLNSTEDGGTKCTQFLHSEEGRLSIYLKTTLSFMVSKKYLNILSLLKSSDVIM